MHWTKGRGCVFAYGDEHGYLVLTGEAEVRLGRFTIAAGAAGLPARTAREAAESVIIFPLGRGPGRPGGEFELAALAASAQLYAERYEAGQDLDEYPGWTHRQQPARPRAADVLADNVKFLSSGGSDGCRNC